MKKTERYSAALKSAGSRVTSQRTAILGIIRNSDQHLDADEIYRRARDRHPRLSLSTVYRNLKALKEAGLIAELDFDESHHHYEEKPASEHYHLVCLNCGKITEFKYPVFQSIKTRVPEARSFEIVDSDIHLKGYCRDCRKKHS